MSVLSSIFKSPERSQETAPLLDPLELGILYGAILAVDQSRGDIVGVSFPNHQTRFDTPATQVIASEAIHSTQPEHLDEPAETTRTAGEELMHKTYEFIGYPGTAANPNPLLDAEAPLDLDAVRRKVQEATQGDRDVPQAA